MATYIRPDGKTFTLGSMDPKTWAEFVWLKLLRLGVSEAYADEEAKQIREATLR